MLVRTGTGGVWLKGDRVGANEKELEGLDNGRGGQVARREEGSRSHRHRHLRRGGASTQGSARRHQLQPGPVYLLVRQGVHTLEYQNQEDLAKDKIYKFAYVLGVNKIQGASAGTALRPVGIV